MIKLETEFGYDFLYDDGSKGYGTVYGDVIHINRPEVVSYIEDILSGNFSGWGYMATVDKLSKDGKITDDEYKKIVKILD